MNPEIFLSLLVLAMVTTWSPGPNNAMVASSGANFGLRRTVPHILGIALGFPLMIFVVGMFLGQIFETSPLLREVIRWVGAGVMLWLAWKIATTGGISNASGEARPLTFLQAAAFQWVNPKAWAMSIAMTSQFVTSDNAATVIPVIALVYVGTTMLGSTSWASFGTAMHRWLGTPGRLIWFNRSMALLIAACVGLLFLD